MFKSGGHVRDIGFVIIYVQAQYNLIARKTTGGFFQDKEASVWHLSLSVIPFVTLSAVSAWLARISSSDKIPGLQIFCIL